MNPNESAFPQHALRTEDGRVECSSAYTGESGLTVRAYIATALASGIMANPNYKGVKEGLIAEVVIAENAVKFADALIAELSKTT